MAKPKFQRGETVLLPRGEDRPVLVGTVFNIMRLNTRWVYQVTLSDGQRLDVPEVDLKARQLKLL